jgi:hypothetical protein
METKSVRTVAIIGCLLLSVSATSAFAQGQGKGRTKIDFKTTVGDFSSSRLFAKLDVNTGVAQLPEVGAKSKNDNLAGYTINLTIGASAMFSGTADEKGKVVSPFDAKLTANGGILQIKATGLDLESLFPLDTTDGAHEVIVAITVTASKSTTATDGTVTTETITLSQQNVTFNYTVKNGQAKGKNF